MRKSTVIAAIVLVAMLAAGPVLAITGDWVEDFEHPFVAMVVFYNSEGQFIWRCSGSLIDEHTLLTAGHCTDAADDGAASARVYFQQDAGENYDPELGYDPETGYPEFCAEDTYGTSCMTSHELYNYGFANFAGFPNIHDAGLVILDEPIYLDEYGVLPEAGILDDLQIHRSTNDTIFTVSGYGLSYRSQPQSPVPTISYRVRLMAASELVTVVSANTDGYNLQTRGNGDDLGGTCSGDSGGPVFLGGFDSNLIVAVTSFGTNSLCRGTDFSYRIDQQDVLDWIDLNRY
jgi:hypothetical protein